MIFLSPGVKTREIDYSTYVGEISSCIVGMVGAATKGPVMVPTLVTSPSDFVDVFGEPTVLDYGAYCALEFLKQGNQLIYTRVGESTLARAKATISAGLITVTLKEQGTYGNKFAVELLKGEVDDEDETTQLYQLIIYKDDAQEEMFTISFDSDRDDWIENVDSYWVTVEYNYDQEIDPYIQQFNTPGFVMDDNNNWHTAIPAGSETLDSISFDTNVPVAASKLKVVSDSRGIWSEGQLVGQSIVEDTTFTVTGLDIEFPDYESEPIDPPAGSAEAAGVTADTHFTNGEAGLENNNSKVKSSKVSGNNLVLKVTDMNELIEYPSSNPAQGTHKWIGLNIDTGLSDLIGITYNGYAFTSDDVDEATRLGFELGHFVLYVRAEELIDTPKEITLASPDYTDGQVNLIIKVVDISQEAFTINFKVDLVAETGLSYEQGIIVECTSEVITGVSRATMVASPAPGVVITPTDAPVPCTGGDDGAPVSIQNVFKGVAMYENTEDLDINLIAAPGRYETEIVNKLLEVAQNRADTLAIIDPPQGLNYRDAIAYHNGRLAGDHYPTGKLNTSYGAFFYPWVKIFDQYSGENIWLPPSGVVLAAFAYNDRVGQPWFAAAGLNRGMLTSVIELEVTLDEGKRDALYGNGNAVNALVNYKQQGFTIWGNKTLQRKSSALDRINVRRLMNMVRKAIAATSAYLVFEQNDPLTWGQWKHQVDPYLESIKRSRGLDDYRTKMDAETVTDYYKDRNQMPGKVWISPTRTAEFIPIDFILTSSGAQFTD